MSIAATLKLGERGNAEVLADNLHGERDWGFRAEPNPELNGRSLSMSMGKVLGGGSSINAQLWARGRPMCSDAIVVMGGPRRD